VGLRHALTSKTRKGSIFCRRNAVFGAAFGTRQKIYENLLTNILRCYLISNYKAKVLQGSCGAFAFFYCFFSKERTNHPNKRRVRML